MTNLLQPELVKLSYDINGNHVIFKVLSCWRPEQKQFIYDSFMENCETIAKHKHGCCIM